MSNFAKVQKSRQRTHRERSQPAERTHLGFLQKKKDYKERAVNYHKKQDHLRKLRQLAEFKNPDEFHHHMIKSKLVNGVHFEKRDESEIVTPEQKLLMATQDLKYVTAKRVQESKKINKIKEGLHLIDPDGGKPKNKHIIFVDSKREMRDFDAADYFDTAPEMIDRRHNRLKKSQISKLNEGKLAGAPNIKGYKLLARRIGREQELSVVEQKMAARKLVADKLKAAKKLVRNESVRAPAVFKFKMKRNK